MPRLDGIDVSKWQGEIGWPEVVASTGITWAAARTWDRQANPPGVDVQFPANRAGMAATGLRHRLLYYWLEPGRVDEGVAEFFAAVGVLTPGEGVMLDAEQEGITEDECLRWCEAVEARTGLPVAVYTGGYTAGGEIWHSARLFNGQRARVFAAYCDEAAAREVHADGIPWHAWQWSCEGQVPGIGANTDLDQVDVPEAFDRACGLVACTDDDAAAIAARVWAAPIHNYIAGADQPAVSVLGFAHAEAWDGGWLRESTNMINGQRQSLADLVRFAHAEAYGASAKCDRILAALEDR